MFIVMEKSATFPVLIPLNIPYSYIDAYGLQRIVRYVSDEWGFRIVGANNLPVAPVDTPEVAQAKAAHFRALAAVGSYH